MSLVDYGPKPSGPTHPPKPPPPPPPPPPTRTLRIGRPSQLPRRERAARLLTRLGVYLLAWGLTGVGCFWLALGSSAGFGIIALAGLTGLLLPTSRPRVRAAVRTSSRSSL